MIASNAVAAHQQFLDVLPGFNLMVLDTSWSLLPVQCPTYFVDLLLNLMISVLNWGPLIMYLSQTLLRGDHNQPTSPSTLILDISLLFTLLSVTLLPALVAAVIIDNLFKTYSYLSQWFLLLQANHPPITLVLSLIPPLLMKVPPSTVPLLWGMHTFVMVKVQVIEQLFLQVLRASVKLNLIPFLGKLLLTITFNGKTSEITKSCVLSLLRIKTLMMMILPTAMKNHSIFLLLPPPPITLFFHVSVLHHPLILNLAHSFADFALTLYFVIPMQSMLPGFIVLPVYF